jgi:hypothetical protein
MEMYGGVDVQIHVLTSASVGGEWSALLLSHINPGTQLDTRLSGAQSGLTILFWVQPSTYF